MLNKRGMVIVTLCTLMVIAGYSSFIFSLSESCLAINAIGCLKLSESCLMLGNISIDNTYRLRGDVPIMVVREHGSQTVVVIEEMDYQGSSGDCDEYEARPEVPCDVPYDVAFYINDTSGDPILTEDGVICP